MRVFLLTLALFAVSVQCADEVGIEVVYAPQNCNIKAKNGDKLEVHYAGRLKDGTEFDSSYKRNSPFQLTLGKGSVIQGWEKGLQGICLCEKRKLSIPSSLGYGARGAGGVIPPNADLVFDTELVGINGKKCKEDL